MLINSAVQGLTEKCVCGNTVCNADETSVVKHNKLLLGTSR